ncbi:DUF2813 domain-containing protein, partial [Vibrio campbellii]
DYAIAHPQTQHLQIVLAFVANDDVEVRAGRYRKIKPVWVKDDNEKNRIYYRISASRDGYDITTRYAFLNAQGEPLHLHHSEKLAQELMSLHPVIRLRDARRYAKGNNGHDTNTRAEKRIHNTCRRLLAVPGHVNKGEIKSSLNTMNDLVEHYFSFKHNTNKNPRK